MIFSVVLLCIAASRSSDATSPRKEDATLGGGTSGASYCKVIAGWGSTFCVQFGLGRLFCLVCML